MPYPATMIRIALALLLGTGAVAASAQDGNEAEAYRIDSLATKALNDAQRVPPAPAATAATPAEQALRDRMAQAYAAWRARREACALGVKKACDPR